MSTNNNKPNVNEQLAQSLIGVSGGNNNEMGELASILKQRFLEENEEKRKEKAQAALYRQQQLDAVSASMAISRNHQDSCSHHKQNNTPNTNGQRDHNGELHLVCSACGKEFDGAMLASPKYRMLNLPAERIGGPQQ